MDYQPDALVGLDEMDVGEGIQRCTYPPMCFGDTVREATNTETYSMKTPNRSHAKA